MQNYVGQSLIINIYFCTFQNYFPEILFILYLSSNKSYTSTSHYNVATIYAVQFQYYKFCPINLCKSNLFIQSNELYSL